MSKSKFVGPSYRAEVICWLDHQEPGGKATWDVPTDPKKLRACMVWSTGFVVSENEQMVELSRDTSEHQNIGASLYILKRCILSRKAIRVPRRRCQ